MSRIHFVFALSSLLLGGCYIRTETGGSDGTGGSCTGSCNCGQPVAECAADADCASGESCRSGVCVSESNPTCAKDSDCAAGSFCDANQKSCVASAVCKVAADCATGFDCDATRGTCAPAPTPTCADLGDEASCSARSDCLVVYAGVDCSCGPDCACKGGEPGCVCQKFEFFRCEAVAQ